MRWSKACTRLGLGLFVLSGLALPVAGVASMGDPDVLTRAGVTREGGELVVVTVACPNERLHDFTVTRWSYGVTPVPTVVWEVKGDATLPDSIIIGVVPPGLVETTPLPRSFRPADQLAIRLDTDQLERASSLWFTVRDVPETGFLSHDGSYDSFEALRRSILHDTPCWDPYGDVFKGRILVGYAVGAVVCWVLGGALVLLGRLGSSARREPVIPGGEEGVGLGGAP